MEGWAPWLIGAVLLPVLGYLVGSIPFGYLAGRLRGLDIREHGSHNIGSTNVSRVLGRPWGLTVFALDVLKGAVPVVAAGCWLRVWHQAGPPQFAGPTVYGVWLITAFAAIAGHIWPVWLSFKGGKGVATSLGVVLGLYPYFTWPGLIALAVWIVVTLASRYVSLGSIVAAVVFPAALLLISVVHGGRWAIGQIWPLLVFGFAMPLLVIWRHRANISRLLAGTENKIGRKKQSAISDPPSAETKPDR